MKSMNDILKNIIEKNTSWAFSEANKLLVRINNKIPKKGYVLFETGYGPSGLPHIGTFGEVLRTSMVRNAFSVLSDIPTKLFVISDDMDGMRKIPDNVPNAVSLEKYMHHPLSRIPDPFGVCSSYADYMNNKLKEFLDSFGFDYEFKSATDLYCSGVYDSKLIEILHNYQKILDIMLPSLGEARQKTYSPFMPISEKSGKVLEVKVEEYNSLDNTISFYEDNELYTMSVTSGKCKLQWKPDLGMRWAALDVDYEMYGKDHLQSASLYSAICERIGGKAPGQMFFELFLDHEGKKISKSKGNGITIDQWLHYAPQESLALYMYQNPKKAKRLYFDVIPRQVDNYQVFLRKFHQEELDKQLINPVFHIHSGDVPQCDAVDISFSLLLNLASACNPEDQDVLWGFIKKYSDSATRENSPLTSRLCVLAFNYYRDFVIPAKQFRMPSELERNAFVLLHNELEKVADQQLDAEELQTLVYKIGKEFFGKENLKQWFSAIYEVILGNKQGPRFGSFIKLYGVNKTMEMIKQKVAM